MNDANALKEQLGTCIDRDVWPLMREVCLNQMLAFLQTQIALTLAQLQEEYAARYAKLDDEFVAKRGSELLRSAEASIEISSRCTDKSVNHTFALDRDDVLDDDHATLDASGDLELSFEESLELSGYMSLPQLLHFAHQRTVSRKVCEEAPDMAQMSYEEPVRTRYLAPAHRRPAPNVTPEIPETKSLGAASSVEHVGTESYDEPLAQLIEVLGQLGASNLSPVGQSATPELTAEVEMPLANLCDVLDQLQAPTEDVATSPLAPSVAAFVDTLPSLSEDPAMQLAARTAVFDGHQKLEVESRQPRSLGVGWQLFSQSNANVQYVDKDSAYAKPWLLQPEAIKVDAYKAVQALAIDQIATKSC